MDMNSIIIAAVVIAAVGIIVGVGLGLFGAKFKVEVDEKEAAVREELPGNNCGGCGYPGCDGLAKAIAEGKAPVNACPVGGAPVGEKIAAIMGVEAGSSEKKVAFVKCKGTCDKTKVQYEYHGIEDCAKASVVPGGGAKACSYGCTGFGTCVKACKFDAIHVVDGVAVVDKEKCVACGACVAACKNGSAMLFVSAKVSQFRSLSILNRCPSAIPSWDSPAACSMNRAGRRCRADRSRRRPRCRNGWHRVMERVRDAAFRSM